MSACLLTVLLPLSGTFGQRFPDHMATSVDNDFSRDQASRQCPEISLGRRAARRGDDPRRREAAGVTAVDGVRRGERFGAAAADVRKRGRQRPPGSATGRTSGRGCGGRSRGRSGVSSFPGSSPTRCSPAPSTARRHIARARCGDDPLLPMVNGRMARRRPLQAVLLRPGRRRWSLLGGPVDADAVCALRAEHGGAVDCRRSRRPDRSCASAGARRGCGRPRAWPSGCSSSGIAVSCSVGIQLTPDPRTAEGAGLSRARVGAMRNGVRRAAGVGRRVVITAAIDRSWRLARKRVEAELDGIPPRRCRRYRRRWSWKPPARAVVARRARRGSAAHTRRRLVRGLRRHRLGAGVPTRAQCVIRHDTYAEGRDWRNVARRDCRRRPVSHAALTVEYVERGSCGRAAAGRPRAS